LKIDDSFGHRAKAWCATVLRKSRTIVHAQSALRSLQIGARHTQRARERFAPRSIS
jgi:hypothetical protein